MTQVQEFALANIARVDITTEETTPKTYTLTDQASQANIEAYVSEGQQQVLRVRNVIKAQNNTEDIVLGYDITLTAVVMLPEVLALIDGGTWDDTEKKYTAPAVGSPVERTPFTLKVYTEEKDTNSDTESYACFSFLHCKGRPANFNLQDGQFFTEELRSRSRPKSGESPIEITYMDTLPA